MVVVLAIFVSPDGSLIVLTICVAPDGSLIEQF